MTPILPSNPSRNGVYRLPASGVDALISQAGTSGFTLHRADLKGLRASRECLVALGKSLDFPPWYGANFDALADCLGDPDWQPVGAQMLLITGAESWRRAHPHDFSTFLEVLAGAADERRSAGQPFWILVDADAELPDPPRG
ncbi:MAG: barstar family protein [Betaproteobacteria bacterium]|nr:barstar family protein [Betaproteobacteria bacterium]